MDRHSMPEPGGQSPEQPDQRSGSTTDTPEQSGEGIQQAKAAIEARLASEDRYERYDAVPLMVKLISHDFHAAMGYIDQALNDTSIEVYGSVAELIDEAVEKGELDSIEVGGIITSLCQHVAGKAKRLRQLEAENAALRETNRDLGQVAAKGAKFNINIGHVGKEGQPQTVILGEGAHVIHTGTDDEEPHQ